VFTDGSREELFADDGAGGVVARFTVRENASLRVAARFGDVRVDDDDAIDVEMVPDRMPAVELEGAPRTVKLVEIEKLDIKWVAHDDHGLREVDLVLRSGAREDRRVLGRFDGETKIERGGHAIAARDAFLRRMFLPVVLTVEAKDNDPIDGPKWSKSAPITLLPPDLGQPEAERLTAIYSLRNELVDFLKWRAGQADEKAAVRRVAARERLVALHARAQTILDATYAGATVVPGYAPSSSASSIFCRRGAPTRARRRSNASSWPSTSRLRRSATAMHRKWRSGSPTSRKRRRSRRAQRVNPSTSKTDFRASTSRSPPSTRALPASRCSRRSDATLGSVTRGDAGRILRARGAGDMTHAELAALHLAGPPSQANAVVRRNDRQQPRRGRRGSRSWWRKRRTEYAVPVGSRRSVRYRAADAIRQLAEQHQSTVRGAETGLEEARRAVAGEADRAEAKRLADKVRQSVEDLPMPGEDLGTPRAAAALAREHAQASAHALEDLALKEASDSAESALGSLDQAERRLDADDSLRSRFEGARSALREALEWSRREATRQQSQAEARAKNALQQAGDTEHDLAEQAADLAAEKGNKEAALPHDTVERLERAGSVMREAARELGRWSRGARRRARSRGVALARAVRNRALE